MDRDRIGRVIYGWISQEVYRGPRRYVGDGEDSKFDFYQKPIKTALIQVLGEEEGNRILALAATGFSSLASGPAMLTEAEREGLKRIEEEYATAKYHFKEELRQKTETGSPEGEKKFNERVARERLEKMRNLFGAERYLDYRLQTDLINQAKAGEMAGLSRDELREWTRLQDEIGARQKEAEAIEDETMREERRRQIHVEYEQRELYLLGAKQADFAKYRDWTYWVIKKFLNQAQSSVNPDLLYSEVRSYLDLARGLDDDARRKQAVDEAQAQLKARYPDLPEYLWESFGIGLH